MTDPAVNPSSPIAPLAAAPIFPPPRRQRVPWESPDLFPLKPPAGPYGILKGRTPQPCTLDELRAKIAAGFGRLPLIWTPDSPRLIPPVEAPELFDVVKTRLIRKMTFGAVRWGLIGAAIAAGVILTAVHEGQPVKQVESLAIMLAIAFGVIPAGQYARSAQVLRTFTERDMVAQGRAARYEAWLKRKKLGATWLLAACILAVAFCQWRVGLNNSIELAGLIKPLPPGQSWRMLTCVFLHGGILHLGVNLFALVVLGRWVEAHARSLHLPLVFILSALAGSVASVYFTRGTSVGASGGLMGLIGYLAVMGYRRRAVLPEGFFGLMLANVVLICLMGFSARSVIDNAAHIGGFVAGVCIGAVAFFKTPSRRPGTLTIALGVVAELVILATVAFTARFLLQTARVEAAIASVPKPVEVHPGLFDATGAYADLYGMKDVFQVNSATIDATRQNLPVLATLRGTFLKPGLYIFQFEEQDNTDWPYEIRNVRVQVGDNSPASVPLISPDDRVWSRYLQGTTAARVNSQAVIQWTDKSPLSPSHWRLANIKFAPGAGQ